MKILVVEDTPINQIMIRVLLEKEGHEALIASTGAEALKRIGSEEFGLALMDIDLPDMSGIEVARAIREKERANGARTPIIAISGSTDSSLRKLSMEAGMDGFWVKPLSVDLLNNYLKSGQSGAAKEYSLENGAGITPFDVYAALEAVNEDWDLLVELAEMFLEDIPSYLSQISAAMSQGGPEVTSRVAHKFKSAALNFGPNPLAVALGEVEILAKRNGNTDSLETAARKAREEAKKMTYALAALVVKGKSR